MKEAEFYVHLAVRIRAFGLPEHHRSNIIDRVTREMQLCFGRNADVREIFPSHNPAWVHETPVVEEQVHGLGEVQEVPEVQGAETPTGAGLRPVPDLLRPMRLSFQNKSTDGGVP